MVEKKLVVVNRDRSIVRVLVQGNNLLHLGVYRIENDLQMCRVKLVMDPP